MNTGRLSAILPEQLFHHESPKSMNPEIINLQNRVTNLELEIMGLKSELKELRMDIPRNVFNCAKLNKIYDAHDDLG
jgi:hypothetical protein